MALVLVLAAIKREVETVLKSAYPKLDKSAREALLCIPTTAAHITAGKARAGDLDDSSAFPHPLTPTNQR